MTAPTRGSLIEVLFPEDRKWYKAMVTDEVSEASAYHLKFEDDYESWYQVEAGSLREMLEGGKFARKQQYRSVALGSAAKPSATERENPD